MFDSLILKIGFQKSDFQNEMHQQRVDPKLTFLLTSNPLHKLCKNYWNQWLSVLIQDIFNIYTNACAFNTNAC